MENPFRRRPFTEWPIDGWKLLLLAAMLIGLLYYFA
jgi:hypothetical protein